MRHPYVNIVSRCITDVFAAKKPDHSTKPKKTVAAASSKNYNVPTVPPPPSIKENKCPATLENEWNWSTTKKTMSVWTQESNDKSTCLMDDEDW